MNKLHLASGEEFIGKSFGAKTSTVGEVVFTTGMTGYLETLTDPSYFGQIVVFTAPLIGNYGVFEPQNFEKFKIDNTFESEKIWVKGVIVTEVSEEFSHCQAFQNFSDWLSENNIPALTGVDTRQITQVLREKGCILGSLGDKPDKFEDLLNGYYVPEVSPQKVEILTPENFDKTKNKTIAFIDCGAKNGILRNFLKRKVQVIRLPYNINPFQTDILKKIEETENIKIPEFDGIFFSNGPGDPEMCLETIEIMKDALNAEMPIFGICLGNQILALASGAKTKKMKYGHRSLNQPVQDLQTKKCIVTSQNHGYEVDETTLTENFKVWFKNLNDNTVEGIRHKTLPVNSVQFHPEACSGPEDAEYLFDDFIKNL